MKITLDSAEKTINYAKDFAGKLNGGEIIYLIGDLGSGKTQFTKGIALGLGVSEEVVSPTFILMKKYKGIKLNLVHIDLYRIEDFSELGFSIEDEMGKQNIIVIEWADKFRALLPKPNYVLEFSYLQEIDSREIVITKGIN